MKHPIMAPLSAIAVLVLLAGCAQVADRAEAETRSAAVEVIAGVIEAEYPGIDARPVATCIVENASNEEVFTVARAAVTGVDDQTVRTVTAVLGRPETLTCIAANGGDLLNQGA